MSFSAPSVTARPSTAGPLVTDVFPGYDHLTKLHRRDRGRLHGASCCVVTPKEHVGYPEEDVRSCIAYRWQRNAADGRSHSGSRDWDDA